MSSPAVMLGSAMVFTIEVSLAEKLTFDNFVIAD